MSKPRSVVRLDLWADPIFDQTLNAAPGIELKVVPAVGDDKAVHAALAKAHAYQISAAKDELPRRWFANEALLADCPNLLFVSSTGAGYDTVDVPACTRAGVAVLNQAGGNAVSVAEHTFGLMLGVSRRMAECDRRMRVETGFGREDVMGHEISGRTLGLVGLGEVGRRVAAIAKAFAMDVIAFDPLLSTDQIAQRGARAVAFDELLETSDFVSLHCPRDPSTMKLMNARAFARMKRGAVFISTARGGIHDEAALVDALRTHHLSGAGIDVWDNEPPPLDHPLLALPNVYATFHTAGVTHEARRGVARIAAEQLQAVLAGAMPERLINPEVWPVVVKKYRALFGAPAGDNSR